MVIFKDDFCFLFVFKNVLFDLVFLFLEIYFYESSKDMKIKD